MPKQLTPGLYRCEELAEAMMTEEHPSLEERIAALEALLIPQFPEVTPEQAEQFKAELDRCMGESKFGHHQVRLLPPGPAFLTPELARMLLRECVTVVKPGETLVIRVQDWSPRQVEQYQEWINYVAAGNGIRMLVVVGEEMGVAEAQPGTGTQNCRCSIAPD